VTQGWLSPKRPYSIAHGGASAYARANTLAAFEVAHQLGADFWEVDLHLSRDGQIVVFHDNCLGDGRALAELTYEKIRAAVEPGVAPLFSDVIKMALEYDTGIYADIKARAAAIPVAQLLQSCTVKRAILGAFDRDIVIALKSHGTPYPVAALVPLHTDPFTHAKGADIIHLCWENLPRPQDLLDREFFDRCAETGQQVVLWHEEDPARMAELRTKPVLGICSDRPELVNPFTGPPGWPVQVVCHRGANSIAPENTLASAHAAFAAGFSHVEIDVHVTSDGELVVFHDPHLARVTNGTGPVCDHTLAELRALDAGGWFSDHFAGEKIPTLDEMLALANLYDANLYIEFKSAAALPVWQAVVAHGLEERCFFWSFVTQTLKDLRAITPSANIMVRRQDFPTLDDALGFLSPALIEYTIDEDWSEFTIPHALDIPTMIAYNGDDPEVMARIIKAHPDMVNLNQPFLFARMSTGSHRQEVPG
jgi:glycerophosphoryl diester phosphodiesterase